MFTPQEKQVLVNIISQSKFTPNEWETIVKPIVAKLQAKEEKVEEKKV